MKNITIFEQLLANSTHNDSLRFLADMIVMKPLKKNQMILASCNSKLTDITLIRLIDNLPCNSVQITLSKLEAWYKTTGCWQQLESELFALLIYSKQRSYYFNNSGLFEVQKH